MLPTKTKTESEGFVRFRRITFKTSGVSLSIYSNRVKGEDEREGCILRLLQQSDVLDPACVHVSKSMY